MRMEEIYEAAKRESSSPKAAITAPRQLVADLKVKRYLDFDYLGHAMNAFYVYRGDNIVALVKKEFGKWSVVTSKDYQIPEKTWDTSASKQHVFNYVFSKFKQLKKMSPPVAPQNRKLPKDHPNYGWPSLEDCDAAACINPQYLQRAVDEPLTFI